MEANCVITIPFSGGIINLLFDGLAYNTSGHFAHCSYFFSPPAGLRKIQRSSQNIRTYYILNKFSVGKTQKVVLRAFQPDFPENFWEQQNIWKGSPVFPDGIFQTEIRVPFLQSHLRYQFQAFAAFLRYMELIWTNGKGDSGTQFTSAELCEPFTHTINRMVNGKQPVFQNNEMAAMLVSQTNLLGVVLLSHVNALFCSNKLA